MAKKPLTPKQKQLHFMAMGVALTAITMRRETLNVKGDSLDQRAIKEATALADLFIGAIPEGMFE